MKYCYSLLHVIASTTDYAKRAAEGKSGYRKQRENLQTLPDRQKQRKKERKKYFTKKFYKPINLSICDI
jgi:hypothetical protein